MRALGALGDHPARVVLAVVGLGVVLVATALALRAVNRRVRSLRAQLLVTTLATFVVGAAAALGLLWLMVLDEGGLGAALVVLALTAVVASGLVVVASVPLGRDAQRLERTVRRIEAGDRDVRTDLDRSDELVLVARALDELNERLATLERERASFEAQRSVLLSSVSHDLRTPLAALRAAAEALADGVAPDPQRYLRSIQRDVEAMASLVEDLSLLVRLEEGRFDVQPLAVDLTEVADEAIEALAPVAAERGLTLVLEAAERVRVQGNAAALGRVIRNLVDNAIRYAPPGTSVRVAVGVDGTPRVRVLDEGPGFPEPFTDHAFERFTRADASRSRDTGGSGLGLAIACGLVEAHGGRIWIEEPPGGRVAFELPA